MADQIVVMFCIIHVSARVRFFKWAIYVPGALSRCLSGPCIIYTMEVDNFHCVYNTQYAIAKEPPTNVVAIFKFSSRWLPFRSQTADGRGFP